MNIDSEAALYVLSDRMLYLVMFCLLYSSKKIYKWCLKGQSMDYNIKKVTLLEIFQSIITM
jgi:hypothetical protein